MKTIVAIGLLGAAVLLGGCAANQIKQLEDFKSGRLAPLQMCGLDTTPPGKIKCDSQTLLCAQLHLIRAEACQSLSIDNSPIATAAGQRAIDSFAAAKTTLPSAAAKPDQATLLTDTQLRVTVGEAEAAMLRRVAARSREDKALFNTQIVEIAQRLQMLPKGNGYARYFQAEAAANQAVLSDQACPSLNQARDFLQPSIAEPRLGARVQILESAIESSRSIKGCP